MVLTESQFIRERCLRVIQKASMHAEKWEWTVLDRVHEALAAEISLCSDEHPVVSFYAGPGSWTLMTTHRLIGSVDGQRAEIGRDDFAEADFGLFKQGLDSPRVLRAKMAARGESLSFLYESGYASMAPIYYFRFWSIKWPVWRDTYRLSMGTFPEVQSPGG